jgi:uncharacterized protein with FMN-binding domain
MLSRGPIVFVVTAVGVILLLSFKTPDPTKAQTGVVAVGTPNGVTDTQPAPSTVPSASSGDVAPTATALPTSPPSSAGGGLKDGQFTGQDVPNRYGDVQVKVTISGGRISDVQALQLPSDRQRSQEISDYVRQPLHDELVQAQSAQIDTVSGATYTSDSYAQSSQSALDQARR